MLKKIKQLLQVTPNKLKNKKFAGKYGDALFHYTLWHPTRHSIQRSALIGLFWSTPPIPLQIPIVIGFCMKFKANLPLALALVWITNPLTIVPITLFEYWLGSRLLDIIQVVDMIGMPEQIAGMTDLPEQTSFQFSKVIALLLGILTLGVCAGSAGYIIAGLVWRWRTIRKWRRRIKRNAASKQQAS